MNAGSFSAAMIQMRSSLTPGANIDDAVRMIGEAKAAGADYVLTPEMTNILAAKREQLFAVIAEEELDNALATLRELARQFGIYIHIGSLAIRISHDRAANRSFLIDPKGDIAARYDKIHMFDVDLAGGESYRESRNYRPGDSGGAGGSSVGTTGTDDLLRPSFPRPLSCSGRGRRDHAVDPLCIYKANRRCALARSSSRPCHRKRLLCFRSGAGRQTRERPRYIRPFTDR